MTAQTLKGAALQYQLDYGALLDWIRDVLWKNGRDDDKSKLAVLRSKIGGISGGRITNVSSADFTGVEDLLDGAAYDAARYHGQVMPHGLPRGKTLADYIHQARDVLLNDIVNTPAVTQSPTSTANHARGQLRDAAKTYYSTYHTLLEAVAMKISPQAETLVESLVTPFMQALRTVQMGRFDRMTPELAVALQEGEVTLTSMIAVGNQVLDPRLPGSDVLGLERALESYRNNIKPLIDDIQQNHGGLIQAANSRAVP